MTSLMERACACSQVWRELLILPHTGEILL